MLDWIPLIFLLQKFQTEENFEKFIYRKCTGDIHKYEYLTGEDILLSNQQQIIEQARFPYSPLGKAFFKANKNNWRSREKTDWCFESFRTESNQKWI